MSSSSSIKRALICTRTLPSLRGVTLIARIYRRSNSASGLVLSPDLLRMASRALWQERDAQDDEGRDHR